MCACVCVSLCVCACVFGRFIVSRYQLYSVPLLRAVSSSINFCTNVLLLVVLAFSCPSCAPARQPRCSRRLLTSERECSFSQARADCLLSPSSRSSNNRRCSLSPRGTTVLPNVTKRGKGSGAVQIVCAQWIRRRTTQHWETKTKFTKSRKPLERSFFSNKPRDQPLRVTLTPPHTVSCDTPSHLGPLALFCTADTLLIASCLF